MDTHWLRITGMTCDHCARTVEAALARVAGVAEARVSFEEGTALVRAREAVAPEQLFRAVAEKGYRAELIERDRDSARSRRASGLHVAILGSGSAAFACAIRAAQEGARVTMIEHATLGGTCVNVGCVPSKIMIRGAQIAHQAKHHPFDGLGKTTLATDRRRMLVQQQARVDELRAAKYQAILDANPGIALVRGRARFEAPFAIEVRRESGTLEEIRADRVLIATGASPAAPPIPGLGQTPFWTSTEALVAEEIPREMIVLGGSVVGLELGQAFARLGARVTVLELMDRLLPTEDEEISRGLREALEAEGIAIRTGFRTESVSHRAGRFLVSGGGERFEAQRLLVATGRRPNTSELGLGAIGVKTLGNGAIEVNDRLETSAPGIFAAGDCTSHPQFVYVAAAAGTRAAINMTGGEARLDLSTIPAVVFTDPQVASCGLNERTARERGIAVETRKLTLDDVPRALANFDTRGFVKLVAEAGTGRLLGAQILAPEAGEIIQTAVLAIRHGMTVQQLGDEIFPYLVMAEGLKLCAQTFTRDVKQLSCCAG